MKEPQNYDGYCVSCRTAYVTSDTGGTCPVCGGRVRPGLKIASDTLLLKNLPMPSDHEIISLWEKQIAEENQRSRDAGEPHPNIGEEFIQAVQLARKYYKMTVAAYNADYDPWANVIDFRATEKYVTDPEPLAARHKYYNREHELVYLPNELIRCSECERTMSMEEWKDKPCPARSPLPPGTYPSTLRASHGYVTDEESSPPAEKAEALPELLSRLIHQHYNHGTGWQLEDAQINFEGMCRALLSECRKMVREELNKATLEVTPGSLIRSNGYSTCTLDDTIKALRIVPGKEGE